MQKTGSGNGTGSAGSATRPSPPRTVVLAAGALVLCGLAAVGAAISLFGLKDWLFRSATTANAKLKKSDQSTIAELHSQVNSTVKGQLIANIVLLLALAFLAMSVYRGRYWARWATLGLWVLATLTGTLAGFFSVLTVASSEPLAFKIPTFLAGVLMVAAVILTSLRPSVAYFNLTKPVRPTGAAPARRGLFAPRVPPTAPSSRTPAQTRPAERGTSSADRSKAKQRASAEAVAKGAELARSRAKASKSRRTGA